MVIKIILNTKKGFLKKIHLEFIIKMHNLIASHFVIKFNQIELFESKIQTDKSNCKWFNMIHNRHWILLFTLYTAIIIIIWITIYSLHNLSLTNLNLTNTRI